MDQNQQLWELYERAFPPDERRSWVDQKKLLKKKEYRVKPYFENDFLIGFICLWELKQCLFVEHLAISEAQRGKGYGNKIVEETIKDYGGSVILEVEYPNDEIAEKRIRFYERLGFVCNDLNYIQPSIGKGKEPIPLILMSYPSVIPAPDAESIINEIYSTVYGVSGK